MNSFFKNLDDNLMYIHINMPVVLLQLKIVW